MSAQITWSADTLPAMTGHTKEYVIIGSVPCAEHNAEYTLRFSVDGEVTPRIIEQACAHITDELRAWQQPE